MSKSPARSGILAAILFLASFCALAQSTVSGTVTSSDNNEALPGASVLLKGTNTGTVTDANGRYSISAPPNGTLVLSSVSYESQEIPVNNRNTIDITLTPDVKSLSEVVVVGYGTQRKSDVTGAVASFDAEDIKRQGPKVNALQALQGSVPGLNITQSSNEASQGSINITIRGNNSITASNNPLIILDGVPFSGGFNEIEQTDIKSIEVLKDASSAAIYGARGANGVIIITTKKGKTGKPQIGYSGSYGLQELYNLPPILSGPEYWDFANERVGSKVVNGFPTLVNNYNAGKFTNWTDLVTRTGTQQRHTVKVSGGSDAINYFLSTSYTDVKGISRGDNFKQLLTRANLSVNVTDWLEIGTNTQYTHQDNSGISAGITTNSGASDNFFVANPLINPYDENGEIAVVPWPDEVSFANPLANLNVVDDDIDRRLFSNNYALIKFPFLPGLSYRLNTGYTYSTTSVGRFWGSNTTEGFRNQGQAQVNNRKETDVLLENILVYDRKFGDHSLNFTGLYSSQNITTESQGITSRRFPTEVLTYYQHNVAEVIIPGSSFSQQRYLSQMGRLNYGYLSKYLLTTTVRRDGYSGFGRNNKFGLFYSAALGWNIHEESFMSRFKNVNQLKLRLSYGENGNQAIDPYQTLAQLEERNYLGGTGNSTAPGYFPSTLATPGLSWETSRSLNGGIDFGFYSNRVSGSLDAYITNTSDLLLDRGISSVHGINSITQNIGQTRNKGIEFLLNTVNVKRGDFTWNTQFNIASNQNRITDLYGNGQDDVANRWFIGKPISVNYDYVFGGVWQKGEDNSSQPGAKPGDLKIKDSNGDGVLDAADRDFIGQRAPTYTAGLTNAIDFRNFSFSFSLFTLQGRTRLNPLWDTDVVTVDARNNTIKLNWWSEDNQNNEYPANRVGTNAFGTRFYQNASFARLRDVTLSYNFADKLLKPLGIKNLQLFLNAKNPLTFTKWKGLDPEFSEQRGRPIDRTFILGLNLGF